ncbi:MAG: hypothetical protein LUF04_12055 [Bacteroides sp.]|nr:hypothetical protein [Bacteroides sp.]
MEYIIYLCRFLFHIRWWLIIGVSIITIVAIILTRNLGRTYRVEATLYTGVISGYSIEGSTARTDWATTQNAMDNLINIIRAESTLTRVSNRLFARVMIHRDLDHDNEYIQASNFRQIHHHVRNSKNGKDILALIDKTSEDKTVENLIAYERPEKDNYIYGLFYFTHPHYSYGALKNIRVTQKGNSDLLEISYSSNDPGITFNTIDILLEEFVNEYRIIRYGETDKVIEYFRSELDRIGRELRIAEDSLTRYNVEKRVINYYDETKEIASINKEFELREQDALFAYNSAKVMIEELEKRMDSNAKRAVNNIHMINKLREASSLTGKISELETLSSPSANADESLEMYRGQLEQARKELTDISDKYVEYKYTKDGISATTVIEQWLDLVLQYEKAKSDLEIVQKSRNDLDDKYAFFAPVGSTIKRQERSINFTEQNYLSVLKSYNDALMRKKNLEMTSATLKVLNPPAFPISPEPTDRRKIVLAAFLGSFLFILGFFLLLELLDRTLRDTIRTQRLTGSKVLGAFPGNALLKYRSYNKACSTIATRFLSTSVLRYFTARKPGLPYIVNFISTVPGEGKTHLSDLLEEYWKAIGLNVHKITHGKDFDIYSREYILAKSVADFYTPTGEDILIVEYPSLKDGSISNDLLQEANINLNIARANRGWKETDRIVFEELKEQAGKSPLFIYLNCADREVVQDFTGMLPPYTYVRQQFYRLSQLSLTEMIKISSAKRKGKKKKTVDEGLA